MRRRLRLRTRAFRVVALIALALPAVLFVVERTDADPSFGLVGSGNVLRPSLYQPSGAPGGAAPQPPPVVALSAASLGLPTGAAVDGLSYGNDNASAGATLVTFSVDNASAGYPLATFDVYAEALGADGAAAADVFASSSTVPAWSGTTSCGPAKANRLLIDGDGVLGGGSSRLEAPGIGLDESPSGPPNPPGTAGRDDLSVLEMSGSVIVDTGAGGPDGTPDAPVFFSVRVQDATAVLQLAADTFLTAPSGADIYAKHPTQGLVRFADAAALGLAVGDEIDALALYHVGASMNFTQSSQDVLVFSLAPGSPSLAATTLPVGNCLTANTERTEADLWLRTPSATALYVNAEQLGLCVKRTYGLCNPFAASGNDNLDALDLVTTSSTDTDGDGIDNAVDPDDNGDGEGDSCPGDYNPNQLNSDSGQPPPAGNVGTIDNGPGVVAADDTIANGDATPDVCDADDDNDGLPDLNEDPLAGCASFNGTAAGHPSPAGGDISNDDNGNGNPASPMGTDAADNGPSWDTDGDGSLDGYECANGYNPRDRLNKPSAVGVGAPIPTPPYPDADGDGLPDNWENRGWGTNPNVQDTDGDGIWDCKEAADLDGNGIVNSTGDLVFMSNAVFLNAGKTADFDLDKNGVVNSTGDYVQMSRWAFLLQPCPAGP